MSENYTPSEHFEAADRAKQHEEGREQAKFYKFFLEVFRSNVFKLVDINEPNKKLSDCKEISIEKLNNLMNEAASIANKHTGTNEIPTAVTNGLINLSVLEFSNYIEDEIKGLIK